MKPFRHALYGFLLLMVTSCTGHLDREIARLDSEIATERSLLTKAADPYRANQDAGFQMDVTGRPVVDALRRIDAVPTLQRFITVQSIERSGQIADWWTKCWPFNRRIGLYIELAHDNALYMVFHLGSTNPRWHDSRGLEFDFNAAGVGGAVLGVGVRFCIGSTYIGAVPVAAVLPPFQRTTGRLSVTPVAEGLRYRLILDDPPYFILGACVFGWCAGAPIQIDEQLTDGTIPNLVGNRGEIQLSPLGQTRRFNVDFRFNHASVVRGGLRVAGPVEISWTEAR